MKANPKAGLKARTTYCDVRYTTRARDDGRRADLQVG
jgi:hypothetical protein